MIKIQGTNQIKLAKEKEIDNFKIMIDIDGVVACWLGGTADVLGVNIEDKTIREKLKKNVRFEDLCDCSEDKMWKKINDKGIDFWSGLELLPWAKTLYNRMKQHGEVCFLTSPGKRNDTAAIASHGKILWIDKHFQTNNYIIAYNKHFCASKNTILIDDDEKKIKNFNDAGGHTFLWPNCFSLMDGDIDVDKALKELVEKIEKYKGE